ncbi:MAG: carboxylating nicotinate-nucleotide diphosphorylase [Gemmatimonadota bacterium]
MGGRGALSLTDLVAAALAEDLGDGDRTSLWTLDAGLRGSAAIVAKADGVVAGMEAAVEAFRQADPDLEAEPLATDGARVRPSDAILRVGGSLRSILGAERTALNFLGRLSGVATLASRFVEAVAGTGCRIVDTRKTTPGWRALEKRAAAAGGAINHRFGLFDMVLIKENHIRAAGGVRPALERAAARAAAEGIEVEIEVTKLDELEEVLGIGADRVLLDNMSLPELRRAVRRVRAEPEPRPLLEASGGVTLETVRAIAETGVDLISVGAITHSAPALDLTLLVTG